MKVIKTKARFYFEITQHERAMLITEWPTYSLLLSFYTSVLELHLTQYPVCCSFGSYRFFISIKQMPRARIHHFRSQYNLYEYRLYIIRHIISLSLNWQLADDYYFIVYIISLFQLQSLTTKPRNTRRTDVRIKKKKKKDIFYAARTKNQMEK